MQIYADYLNEVNGRREGFQSTPEPDKKIKLGFFNILNPYQEPYNARWNFSSESDRRV